jgi:UPF0755 protein
MKRVIVSFGLILLLLAGGLGGGWIWFGSVRTQPGPLEKDTNIVVAHGSLDRLAAGLADAGAIDNATYFKLAVWLTNNDGQLRAAEFSFPAHASLNRVLAILRTAKPVQHRVTIPEGLTAHQIASVLTKADSATGDVGRFEEGSVLPQTYDYEFGAPRDGILARARTAMTKALAAAWAARAPDLPLSTPHDAVILASIVERETAKPDERAHVAAVYENRLRQGMKLQADPTVVYAASNGAGVLDHPLTRAELDRDEPFNTYRNTGLPPGPICAPSVASIQAVLHPVSSSDLFFVADGSGGHTFAATREEHERNVARYRGLQSGRAQ